MLLFIKKTLKLFGPKSWCTKKPFGYRVVHHRYFLTSCSEQITIKFIMNQYFLIFLQLYLSFFRFMPN